MEDIILKLKEAIAKKHGYPSDTLGTAWEFAMMATHRKKKQLQLYDELVCALAKIPSEIKENELSPLVSSLFVRELLVEAINKAVDTHETLGADNIADYIIIALDNNR